MGTIMAGLEGVIAAGSEICYIEQYRNNRLIRPRAEYKGNPDGQTWIPIAER